jgi:hypothetical protein
LGAGDAPMIRISLFVLALVSLFTFPWPYTIFLITLFALYVPLGALGFGILADALYYTPGIGLPMATVFGAIGFIATFFINRFIRHRITDLSFD